MKRRKLLFILLLSLACLLPSYGQDLTKEKRTQVIQSILGNLRLEVKTLRTNLGLAQKEIESSTRIIGNSEKTIASLNITLDSSEFIIKEQAMQLQAGLNQLQQSKNSLTLLSSQFSRLEKSNDILLGVCIGLGAVAIVEGIILMIKVF